MWGCPSFDLLSAFEEEGLDRLCLVTKQVQKELTAWITEHGGVLKQYDSFEAFEQAGS